VSEEDRAASHRRLCRHIAAAVVQCMADTDMSFAEIAERIGSTAGAVKRKIDRLIAGRSISFRDVSDFATAMGASVRIRLVPREPEPPPATNTAPPATPSQPEPPQPPRSPQ